MTQIYTLHIGRAAEFVAARIFGIGRDYLAFSMEGSQPIKTGKWITAEQIGSMKNTKSG